MTLTLGQVIMSVVASDIALTMGFSNTSFGISKSKEYSIIASSGENCHHFSEIPVRVKAVIYLRLKLHQS